MLRSSRLIAVVGCLLVAALAGSWLLAHRARDRGIDAGFWFERVTYTSTRLAGTLSEDDLKSIDAVARQEIVRAFTGLRLNLSQRADAVYRVRVVQTLSDPRFNQTIGVSGESRAVPGFGGQGTVSFYYHASNAEAFAEPGAERTAIIAAIGRGLGRAAVHEFAHQLLPSAPIDSSRNVRSYEYESGARREEYYGPMEWDFARALLERRYGEQR